jgi:hypothetical protein
MDKIYEEAIVIKLSKLIKNDQEPAEGSLATSETVAALEQVVQELVGKDIIVEVEVA